MPTVNASEKAKEKAELGTRIASRLSLVGVSGFEPEASWSRTKHATSCAIPRNEL